MTAEVREMKTKTQQEIMPTATVCAKTAPSGKPEVGNMHCGVRGRGVGNGEYFLGRYLQNGNGIEVTLKGCWQFCGVSVLLFISLLLIRFANRRDTEIGLGNETWLSGV